MLVANFISELLFGNVCVSQIHFGDLLEIFLHFLQILIGLIQILLQILNLLSVPFLLARKMDNLVF